MFSLRSISVFQFKNYTNRLFEFPSNVTGICGNNGVGKTNLLDAIHFLCFTKSYFTRVDSASVQQGMAGFRIEGRFELAGKEEKAVCILRENGRKDFMVDDRPYDKFSQHIGRYPCVVIAPDDAVLVTGGNEERRKFLDSMLSQVDGTYLQQLIVYTKVLQQRNALLKTFADGNVNYSLLEVLDEQLVRPGQYLFDKRKDFLLGFLPQVRRIYHDIARQPEEITLVYESQLLHESFTSLLMASRQKDCLVQRTMSGLHRDNIEISFGSQPFRNIASQGQRKSLLFALKLAEMEVLRAEKGFAPLLLLDDVFEKLDEDRISNLLQRVCIENDGQVFITDTNRERLTRHLEQIGVRYDLVEL